MKKKKTLYLLIVTFWFGCNPNSSKQKSNATSSDRQIEVEINQNIETVGIILSLSELGDYIINNYSTKTKKYVLVKAFREKFKDFKSHQAVVSVNQLAALNLIHFNHYYYGLYFSALPNFERVQPLDKMFVRHDSLSPSQVDSLLIEWDRTIKTFYTDARLKGFFYSNKALYENILTETKATIPKGHIKVMEVFFGDSSTSRYIICPSAVVPNSFNFGPNLRKNTNSVSYYVTGPAYDVTTAKPNFDAFVRTDSLGFNDKEYIADLAIHEFGHSFVRFINEKKYEFLVDSLNEVIVKRITHELGHGRVDRIVLSSAFEEHLVRASEVMILRDLEDTAKAKQKLVDDYQEGYVYLNEFVSSLENYKKNRDKYPTIEGYFNTLLNDVFGIEQIPVKE